MKVIGYNKQFIDSKDKKSLLKVLDQKFITGGESVNIFEKKLKNFLNVKYAITCINGTAGLHLAFESLNLKKSDVVIMPIVNFIASYSMANLYKSKIFFADVDGATGQMTPETLEKCIKKNNIQNIKAVVLMYMGGYPENILNFYKLKKKYGFYIVEDACHALGASYKHKEKTYKVGSCTHSDICVFSFHPVKTITTGEGGLICTNNKRFNEISKKFRNHNISRDKYYWDYNINKTAFNYRLSDLNCALGISQLKKINFFLSKRKKIFKEYNKLLIKNKKFFKFGEYSKNNKPSFHLYILSLKFQGKKSKKKLLQYLNRNKIFPQYHYKPINLFTFSKKLNLNFNDFIGAKNYYKSSISIPLYVDLKLFQIKKICKLILNYLTR